MSSLVDIFSIPNKPHLITNHNNNAVAVASTCGLYVVDVRKKKLGEVVLAQNSKCSFAFLGQ